MKDCSDFPSVPSISVSVNQENRNHVMFLKKRRFNRTDWLSRYEKNERAKRKTLRYHRYHPLVEHIASGAELALISLTRKEPPPVGLS